MKNSDGYIRGTSLQGYVDASYDELVKTFGKPTFEDDADLRYEKTSTEWRGQINGSVYTIYDYKWRRDSDDSIEQWHVGGTDSLVVLRVEQRLKIR